MEMNPDAAEKLGIAHGSYAQLTSRRGDAVVLVQLTHRVPPNMVFIPFHFHECVNELSLGLLDPHSRQPAFKHCSVHIQPAADQKAAAERNHAARSY
jgi:assimilatory nitrate reductase catalytic subunit